MASRIQAEYTCCSYGFGFQGGITQLNNQIGIEAYVEHRCLITATPARVICNVVMRQRLCRLHLLHMLLTCNTTCLQARCWDSACTGLQSRWYQQHLNLLFDLHCLCAYMPAALLTGSTCMPAALSVIPCGVLSSQASSVLSWYMRASSIAKALSRLAPCS